MSYSSFIAEVFHNGILELSTIVTPNLLDSSFCSIVNNFDMIDYQLTCFILGMKEESPRESYEVINNDKTILFLSN